MNNFAAPEREKLLKLIVLLSLFLSLLSLCHLKHFCRSTNLGMDKQLYSLGYFLHIFTLIPIDTSLLEI